MKTLCSLLIPLLVFLTAMPSWAAIALVQSKDVGCSGAGTTCALTWDSNTTTGNLIACLASGNDATTSVLTTITDSQSNSQTLSAATRQSTFVVDLKIGHAMNITGGVTPTVTATWSASNTGRNLTCAEFSGLAAASALDQAAGQAQDNPGTGANAVSSGNVTTTQADELLIGGTCCDTANLTAGTSYTFVPAVPATNNVMEYRIVSSTGTYAATFTVDSATDDFATRVATFKAEVEASGGVPSGCGAALILLGRGAGC